MSEFPRKDAEALQTVLRALFPALVTCPFNAMHLEAIADKARRLTAAGADLHAAAKALETETLSGVVLRRCATADRPPAARSVIIAPRGAAKSTLFTLMFPLIDMMFGTERYLLIFSSTVRQAAARLKAIRSQLAGNDRLRALMGLPPGFTLTESNTRAVEAGGTRIEACGATCEVRGLSHEACRPTHIILDDIDTDDTGHSPERAAALIEWFRREILPIGHPPTTHITAVGTVVHSRSLLVRLSQTPGYDVRRYSAVTQWSNRPDLWSDWERRHASDAGAARAFLDEHRAEMLCGTQVLWPERQTYEQLMELRAEMGHRAFTNEYQNEPRSPEEDSAIMRPDAWTKFRLGESAENALLCIPQKPDGTDDHAAAVPLNSLRTATYLDPAGAGTGGDFAAIVTAAFLGGSGTGTPLKIYIVHAELLRGTGLRHQAQCAARAAERFGSAVIVHEKCGALDMGEFLMPALDGMGLAGRVRLHGVVHNKSKLVRAARFEHLLKTPAILAECRLPTAFLEQCESFGQSGGRAHDDAPDALIGLLEIADSLVPGNTSAPGNVRTRFAPAPRPMNY